MRSGRPLDIALAALLVVALASSLATDFDSNGDLVLAGKSLGPGCASRLLTGFECPFCGISHSFVALADGDIEGALSYHPLGPVVASLFLAFIVAVAVVLTRKRTPVVETRMFLAVSSCLLATSIAVWGARMFLG